MPTRVQYPLLSRHYHNHGVLHCIRQGFFVLEIPTILRKKRDTRCLPDHETVMDILPLNFRILRLCGVWKESEDRSVIPRLAKSCYKCTVVTLIFTLTASQVIALWLAHDDVEDVTESLFIVLTFVAFCVKLVNFLLRQAELSVLLNHFRADICRSKNSAEEMVLRKYGSKVKRCTNFYITMSVLTGVALSVIPLTNPSCYAERILPIKVYIPYSMDDPRAYATTYLYQAVTGIYSVLLNVSFDSLVYGLTIHACGQVDLLRHRIEGAFHHSTVKSNFVLRGPPRISGANLIEVFVKHHIHVRGIGMRIESMFVGTTTILFIFSLITLCTSIFQMSKKQIYSVEFLILFFYLGSMLLQVFCYCWYGNEFMLKSKSIADSVYACDWTATTPETRSSLLLIMVLGQKGLSISFYGVFALALPTFTWILKTSYSAFSLLQNMSDEE